MTRILLLASALLLLPSTLSARTFFELLHQGFRNGGRSGLETDATYQFNGPLFVFDEPDVLGPASGTVDVNPDGPTLWARALGGYDSNPAGFKAGDGSWFGGAQAGGSENFSFGPQKVFVGGRARYLQYDDDIFRGGRDGDDASIFDLDLRVGLNRQFSESIELTTFLQPQLRGHA